MIRTAEPIPLRSASQPTTGGETASPNKCIAKILSAIARARVPIGTTLTITTFTGPVNVVIVSVVPIGTRALAMALSIFAIHLFGDAVSPPVVGWLADLNGIGSAVLIMPAAIALSGLIWTATAAVAAERA